MRVADRIKTKKVLIVVMVFCSVNLIIIAVVALSYFLAGSSPVEEFHATVRNDVDFTVHYHDNDVFGGGARPHGKHYLMSYTDFIEVEHSLSAAFDDDVEVSFRCSVTETILIRHIRSSDRNSNPIVYIEEFPVSEIEGVTIGRRITFYSNENGQDGGVYIIYPYEHIDVYRDFVSKHNSQMRNMDVTTDRSLLFSAEIYINITYNLRIGEKGINQTFTRGVTIPISSEVFLPELTGEQVSELSTSTESADRLGFLSIILLVAWFSLLVYGFSYSIRRLVTMNADEHRLVDSVIKKYSDELVMSTAPIDLSGYAVVPVRQFQELLKSAIILGKHIICHHDERSAAFCVIDGDHAYFYEVEYTAATPTQS